MAANDDALSIERFLSTSQILDMTGWSRTTLWREVKAGRFPQPIPTTAVRVGWLESEVRAWQQRKITERDRRHDRPMGPEARRVAAAAKAGASA